MTKEDIIKLIQEDEWMMMILKTVQKLNLPDWWIGAGFVRGKVWDTLHGYTERTLLPDIDVIYLDKREFSQNDDKEKAIKQEERYEKILHEQINSVNWSVKNQARMHLVHDDNPYTSSEEALSKWVETATCIGVRLDEHNQLILATPRGIDDLVQLILRPTPHNAINTTTFTERITKKKWLKKWPKLKVVM